MPYLDAIGKLPSLFRKDVETIWLHKGTKSFGGGNNNLLIHHGRGLEYMKDGLLEEAFLHEASHTSLDREHASSKGWLAAVQADGGNFISDYAKEYPQGEDIAETFPICFALQYKPESLKKSDIEKIKESIPNRLAYCNKVFEQYELNKETTQPISQQVPKVQVLEKEPLGKSCTLANGEIVEDGWRGKGAGNNYCNNCFCSNGMLGCTKMACPPLETKMKIQSDMIKGGQIERINPSNNTITVHFAKMDGTPDAIMDDIRQGILDSSQLLPINEESSGVTSGDLYVTVWHTDKSDHAAVVEYRCTYTPYCPDEHKQDLIRRSATQGIGAAMLSDEQPIFEIVWRTNDQHEFLPESPWVVAGHEWTHTFQNANIVNAPLANSFGLETVPRTGPIWLLEGTADFIGRLIAQEKRAVVEGYDVRQRSKEAIQFTTDMFEMSPQIQANDVLAQCESPANQIAFEAQAGGQVDPSWPCVSGSSAINYLMHLNEAQSINRIHRFYADISSIGWQASFQRNYGRTIETFYEEFGNFLTNSMPEKHAVIDDLYASLTLN